MKRSKLKKTSTLKRVKPAKRSQTANLAPVADGPIRPVTLEQARAMVRARAPRRALAGQRGLSPIATRRNIALERKQLTEAREQEKQRRVAEYKATMTVMKKHGVKGLAAQAPKAKMRRAAVVGLAPAAIQPLQVFAGGDSWFDYPVPMFGGGIIPRLERRLGVPILNLAKAGDEVRLMLGVEERKVAVEYLGRGCPTGGPWDVLLFSGGGNDIVGNPMALWVRDYMPSVPAKALIHSKRFDAALELILAGYEDLITLRDTLSPSTHLIFHAYDFAIPDGRGICFYGPWMKPTFDLHRFPVASSKRFQVVKEMLTQFAALLQPLTQRKDVTFINGQGTLAPTPSSWHNELHPSRAGFDRFADLFHSKLKALFPTRVL